jgi:hypothetical protein
LKIVGDDGIVTGCSSPALIAMPAGAIIAEIVHITDPVTYAASLILIIAACHARRMYFRHARGASRYDADAGPGISQRCKCARSADVLRAKCRTSHAAPMH